jgi:hypothetical protein
MEMYYEDEFYNEPSEFDLKVEEFKTSLLASVKEDYVAEMERLKEENAQLQEVKENFEEIKREYEKKKHQLEFERKDLNNKLRRERMVDLLSEHKIILYRAYSKRELPPKCDKCDNRRKVEYVSPLGRKTSEDCLCKEGKTVYCPFEFIRYEFRLNRDKNGVTAWYKQYSDDQDGLTWDTSTHADRIYTPDMNYEDIKQYTTFFKTKEECQSYCDWLNEKE